MLFKADENQGWNSHREEEKRRYYREWAKQSDSWRREDDYEEDHNQQSESPKSKGSASSLRMDDLFSRILDNVEGSIYLLKGMKFSFSSLTNRVNSHADAIKLLEGQLSLLSAQLKKNDRGRQNHTHHNFWGWGDRGPTMVMHSGRVAVGDMEGNNKE